MEDFIKPSLRLDRIITMLGIILAVITYRKNHLLAKINFSIQLTNSHRDIWSKITNDEDLRQIKSTEPKFSEITQRQKRYVNFILLNTRLAWQGYSRNLYTYDKKARLDTGNFFNLPIPKAVWIEVKDLQNKKFSIFIEKCRQEAIKA